jgi:SAM-dependent methyltransferase
VYVARQEQFHGNNSLAVLLAVIASYAVSLCLIAGRIGGWYLSTITGLYESRESRMAKLSDPWDHHDWSSREYVSGWAERQNEREIDRQEIFRLIARTLAVDTNAAISILDLGSGYGALAQFLLEHFPRATAVCQDGSDEMVQLGRQRMEHLRGRFQYVLCDFSKAGWSSDITQEFDAVVSSIAIHNVRSPDVIRSIYQDSFHLLKNGGCFLNFDRMTPSQEQQIGWLEQAGFNDVKCFWDGGRRALIGGYKK